MGAWAEEKVFPATVAFAKQKGWLKESAEPTCFISAKNRPGKASYHLIVSFFWKSTLVRNRFSFFILKANDMHFPDNRALSVFWKQFWDAPGHKGLRQEAIDFFGGQERFYESKAS